MPSIHISKIANLLIRLANAIQNGTIPFVLYQSLGCSWYIDDYCAVLWLSDLENMVKGAMVKGGCERSTGDASSS
jgi:hypothetical protein